MLFSRCNVTPEYKVTLWSLELRGHLFTTVQALVMYTLPGVRRLLTCNKTRARQIATDCVK